MKPTINMLCSLIQALKQHSLRPITCFFHCKLSPRKQWSKPTTCESDAFMSICSTPAQP